MMNVKTVRKLRCLREVLIYNSMSKVYVVV